jgi:hypothetical protein
MAINSISSNARAQLLRSQARLDADTVDRNAAARAVDHDNEAVAMAQQAARRELQSRSAKGTVLDVTV